MARTNRRQPTDRESKNERLEREWERQVAQEKSSWERRLEKDYQEPQQLPAHIETIRQEAETLLNARAIAPTTVDKAASRVPFSVQSPVTDEPREMGGGLVWWTGRTLSEYVPVHEYGDQQRGRDLRAFALLAPFILNAESVLTKKVQALQWTIEGGRNLAKLWQERLNNFENGDGWDTFIGRWVRSYSENDKLALAELIRAVPSWAVDENAQLTPRGERAIELGKDAAWSIVDSRVMDPVQYMPTTSKEFPIIYTNSYTGQRHRLRPYQFMSLIDMPSIDDRYPGLGVCAVSRAVFAAQEDRMIVRYAMEKMSENPGAGIGVINASVTALQTALKEAKAERESRGVVYYKGVIFLPILNPTGTTSLEFLSFAGLPDGFDRSQVYNILKEVVATSFGLDILELGSIPGRLGTATQAKVAAQKGRVKSIGAIMQGIERAFRFKLLPEAVTFRIKKHDAEEEAQRASIDEIYFENAIRYAQFASPELAQLYLAEKGAIPNEPPFIQPGFGLAREVVDVEPAVSEEQAEAEQAPQVTEAPAIAGGPEGAAEADIVKRWHREGPRVRLNRDGDETWVEYEYRLKVLGQHIPRFRPLASNGVSPLPIYAPQPEAG